jgi:hypothetical protein
MPTQTNDTRMVELFERLVIKVERISEHLELYSGILKDTLEEEGKCNKEIKTKIEQGIV